MQETSVKRFDVLYDNDNTVWHHTYTSSIEKPAFIHLTCRLVAAYDSDHIGTPEQRRFVKALRAREDALIEVFNAAVDEREAAYEKGIKIAPLVWDYFHIDMARGCSHCHMCPTRRSVGNYEFDATLDGVKYIWPEKYAHYVEIHGMRPDPDFEKAIMNNRPHIYSSGIPKVASVL
jgi:hypothetical protein